MGMKIAQGSHQGVSSGVNTLSDIAGKWAISYWATLPAQSALSSAGSGQEAIMHRNDNALGLGWDLWNVDPARQSGKRQYFESLGLPAFTNSGFDAAYNSGLHHWLWCKIDSSNVRIFIDAVGIESIVPNQLNPPGGSLAMVIGAPARYGGNYDATAEVHDVRIYKDLDTAGISMANLAKMLFESRGMDGYTEGLIGRWPLNGGPDGSVITQEADLSPVGNHIATYTNSPTYIAAPLA